MVQNMNEDGDGFPSEQCIVVEDLNSKETYDLRRCKYYLRGHYDGKEVLQLSKEPSFTVHLTKVPTQVSVRFSVRLKKDMYVDEVVVTYNESIKHHIEIDISNCLAEKGDLFNITFDLKFPNKKVTVRK